MDIAEEKRRCALIVQAVANSSSPIYTYVWSEPEPFTELDSLLYPVMHTMVDLGSTEVEMLGRYRYSKRAEPTAEFREWAASSKIEFEFFERTFNVFNTVVYKVMAEIPRSFIRFKTLEAKMLYEITWKSLG